MNQADALDLVRSAIWTVMLASGPAIVAAMLVGVFISLLQALTQIQEATLHLHSQNHCHIPCSHAHGALHWKCLVRVFRASLLPY